MAHPATNKLYAIDEPDVYRTAPVACMTSFLRHFGKRTYIDGAKITTWSPARNVVGRESYRAA